MEETRKENLQKKEVGKVQEVKKGRYQRRVLKSVESVQACGRITQRKQSYGWPVHCVVDGSTALVLV